MSAITTDNIAARQQWSGTVDDADQPKKPLRIGIALAIGVLLWLGPYLASSSVLLPAKVAEVAPEDKVAVLASMSAVAMVVAAIANVLFGALSDLTRSKIGRRAPWLLAGSVLSALMLWVVSIAPSVPTLLVAWAVYQLFLNAIVAPLLGVMSDRVAPSHRGTVSSIYALGYSAGLYGGSALGAQFLGDIRLGFIVMAILTLLSGPVAVVLLRESSSLPMPKRKFDKSMVLDNFSFPLKNCRDYYLALFGKFMVIAATFAISGFQLYIFTDYIGLNEDETAGYVSIISMILLIAALVMSATAGPISDRLKMRKIPVMVSAILVAIGVLIPFFGTSPSFMIGYAVVAGIGMGAFNAVDQALNVEVLPNPETAAKDLGVLNLANTGGQILGPVLAATAVGVSGYHLIFPAAALCALIGGALVMLIRKTR